MRSFRDSRSSAVLIAAALYLGIGALGCERTLAADWSSFRGPNATGIAQTGSLPVEFGPEKNVVWKTPLPAGKSSPVLTEDRIFLTAHDETGLLTICLDRATGKILWRQAVPQEKQHRLHQLNDRASPTPATDGSNVYSFFGDFGLVSYGPDGNQRWVYRLGPFVNQHGMTASPIVVDDNLIMVCDQDDTAFVLALHKDTGEVAWRTERPEVSHGFSTPAVFRPQGGEAQVVIPGSYVGIAYSVRTGEKLWWARGLTWQTKPAAVVEGDIVIFTGWAPGADPGEQIAYPSFEEILTTADANHDGRISPEEIPEKLKPESFAQIDRDKNGFANEHEWMFYGMRRGSRNITLAVRPGDARGDLTSSHVIWSADRYVPEVPTPLAYEGLLYMVKDGGILTVTNLESGEMVKVSRMRGAIDKYYSSPVAGDGKIYLISETGKLSVLKPGVDWETLAVNDMGEPAYATPAIEAGRIYLRTASTLYCFAKQN